MMELELDELYARYLAGHALGRERRPRPTPSTSARLKDWSLELGYVDGLSSAPIRAEADFALWCLCYRAYLRAATIPERAAPGEVGEAVEGEEAASAVELRALLGSRDARSGQWRSPRALVEVLRTLTNAPRPR